MRATERRCSASTTLRCHQAARSRARWVARLTSLTAPPPNRCWRLSSIDLGASVRLTQEFATDPYPMMVSNLVAAALLRGELALLRQARNAGVREAPPLAHLLRHRVADYFYPQDAHWKNLVTTRGLLLLDRALAWVSLPA